MSVFIKMYGEGLMIRCFYFVCGPEFTAES